MKTVVEGEVIPKGEITLISGEIYIPDLDKAVQAWERYQALCRALLTDDDYAVIGGRKCPKRSGCAKLRRAFNISAKIVAERWEELGEEDFGYLVTIKASLPWGRFEYGDGYCSSDELKYDESAIEPTRHNVRAKAITRAKNRATLDIIGAGEVSAEEFVGETGSGVSVEPRSIVLSFGKHKGKTLGSVLETESGYVAWLAENAKSPKVKRAAMALVEASKSGGEQKRAPQPNSGEDNGRKQKAEAKEKNGGDFWTFVHSEYRAKMGYSTEGAKEAANAALEAAGGDQRQARWLLLLEMYGLSEADVETGLGKPLQEWLAAEEGRTPEGAIVEVLAVAGVKAK